MSGYVDGMNLINASKNNILQNLGEWGSDLETIHIFSVQQLHN